MSQSSSIALSHFERSKPKSGIAGEAVQVCSRLIPTPLAVRYGGLRAKERVKGNV
jgi:hypothetical protein